MTDTVTKLMGMVDRYWDLAYAEGAEGRTHDTPAGDAARTRQALEDELTRLFTPLTDEQSTKFLRDECIYTSEDICGWSFGQGVKWAEKQHGIAGESK